MSSTESSAEPCCTEPSRKRRLESDDAESGDAEPGDALCSTCGKRDCLPCLSKTTWDDDNPDNMLCPQCIDLLAENDLIRQTTLQQLSSAMKFIDMTRPSAPQRITVSNAMFKLNATVQCPVKNTDMVWIVVTGIETAIKIRQAVIRLVMDTVLKISMGKYAVGIHDAQLSREFRRAVAGTSSMSKFHVHRLDVLSSLM